MDRARVQPSSPLLEAVIARLSRDLLSFATSKQRLLCRRRRAERSYSMFKARRGSREKIPLIQGKEQRLRFAGAAVKRYPTSKVRETQVRR